MLNSVCLMGRLCKDPELRQIQNQGGEQAVTSFRLATDLPVAAGAEKQTLFIDVSIFGKRAETVAKYMRKGSLVAVTGRLNQRKFVSNKTNMEVTVTEIIASQVDFAEPKPAEGAPVQADGVHAVEAPTYVERPPQAVSGNTQELEVDEDSLPF